MSHNSHCWVNYAGTLSCDQVAAIQLKNGCPWMKGMGAWALNVLQWLDLTHWPLGDFNELLDKYFSSLF